jgi:hypothetical protein
MNTLDLAFLSAKFSARVPYLMSGTLDASTLSALSHMGPIYLCHHHWPDLAEFSAKDI